MREIIIIFVSLGLGAWLGYITGISSFCDDIFKIIRIRRLKKDKKGRYFIPIKIKKGEQIK